MMRQLFLGISYTVAPNDGNIIALSEAIGVSEYDMLKYIQKASTIPFLDIGEYRLRVTPRIVYWNDNNASVELIMVLEEKR